MGAKHVPQRGSPQLIEVYGDGVIRLQHVRQWCREFENSRMDVYDDGRTSRPSTSGMVVKAVRVEE